MIFKDQNTAWLTVGKSAAKHNDWAEYAQYCFDREKGLRKEAFQHLKQFIKSTESLTLEKKIEIITFLFPFLEVMQDTVDGLFPQPLRNQLIQPALLQWCDTEEENENPFRWYGKFYRSEKDLFKAMDINPKDDLARQTLLGWWAYFIYYSVHHLPESYIGEPEDDLKLADDFNRRIAEILHTELVRTISRLVQAFLRLLGVSKYKTTYYEEKGEVIFYGF